MFCRLHRGGENGANHVGLTVTCALCRSTEHRSVPVLGAMTACRGLSGVRSAGLMRFAREIADDRRDRRPGEREHEKDGGGSHPF